MEGDVFARHCFRDLACREEVYRDEYGNRLAGRQSPCGVYGLSSYRVVEEKVCLAFDLPFREG